MSRRMSLPRFLAGSAAPSAPAPASPMHPSPMSSTSPTAADPEGAADAQQIRVVVRTRPLSDRELLGKTPVIVSVAHTSVQVINPVVFLDPAFLEAISTPAKRVTPRDVPLALSAQALAAAAAAGESRTFHFDRCFGVDNAAASEAAEPFAHAYDIDLATQRPNQELVFDEVGRDMVASALQGFNCTVLAYGQTGSGKTHTMVGAKTHHGKGLIPRVCEALFAAVDERRAREAEELSASDDVRKTTVYSAHVSYCEIYKEKVNDLLDPSAGDAAARAKSPPLSPSHGSGDAAAAGAHELSFGSSSSRRTLRVREHPATGPFVEGLSARAVASYADIAEEMVAGEKLRTVAATLMNPMSSRSHAVFTVTFTQTTFDPATQTAHDKTSKISMIDLAGSERANASGTSGDRLKEGAMINKSLTTLGRVISALSKQGGERVPYRDSTLTWLLKESLGGNAKTTMIAMISPSSDSYDETMSTLRYAESAKRVTNRAVVNEDKNARIIRQLRQEIQDLRLELEQTKLGATRTRSGSSSGDTAEREEFFAQLVQEVKQLRSLQAQSASMPASPPPESEPEAAPAIPVEAKYDAVRVHKTLPSLLVDISRQRLRTDGALAYALAEGTTVFGSAPQPEGGAGESSGAQDQLRVDTLSPDERKEQTPPPKRSWSPTFLRRKVSGSDAGKSPQRSTPRRSLSPRWAKSSSVATEPIRAPETKFYELASGGGVAAQHMRIYCSSEATAGAGAEETPSYVVEVEAADASARVYLNGGLLSPDDSQRVRVHHADRLQLGDACFFTLHASADRVAIAEPTKGEETEPERPRERLTDLVHEANAICARWQLNLEFALPSAGNQRSLDNDEAASDAVVLVKTHLDDQRDSVAEWTRPRVEAKVAFLRELAASLEDTRALAASEEAREKVSSPRGPDAACEDETKAPELPSPPKPTPTPTDVPPSVPTGLRHSHATPTPQTTASCVRLIGLGRVFMPPLKSYSSGPMIAAVFSGAGESVGKLFMHLQYTASAEREERRPSLLALARRPSLLAVAQAAAKPKAVQTTMRIHLDKLVLDDAQWTASDGVALTLKRWSSASSAAASGAEKPTTRFATPRLAPSAPSTVFEVNKVFETRLSFAEQSAEAAGDSTGDGDAQDDFVAFEIWGFGRAAAHAPAMRAVDFYASVDVDERDPDGVFRAAAVKADGALRLRANQPRRLRVRITQSDAGSFALSCIESVAISRPFRASVDTARLAAAGAKSAQWLLSSGCIRPQRDEDADGVAPAPPAPLNTRAWCTLELRSEPERDPASRSLLATLKWNPQLTESPDGEGSRSVFRVAVAFTTAWSRVPVVVSKSVVVKLARATVSTTTKLARELECSRRAWWAREGSGRDFRLGAWYTAEVSEAAHATSLRAGQEEDGSDEERSAEAESAVADAVVASHVKSLRRLELVLELEHLRQQILKLTPFSATETVDAGARALADGELSFDKVAECLSTLFESNDDQEQRFEIVELQSRTQLFLRKKTRRDVLIGVKYGSVVDLAPAPEIRELHAAHFVAEPSHVAGGSDGEIAGFLMLSTALQLDEAAVAPLGAAAKARERPAKPGRASWERRWVVLRRPFLCAYKSVALEEEVGVLDVSRCQLLASPSPSPLSTASRGSQAPTGTLLASIPFGFQLVCLAGAKCVVWTLQASTAPEMRAWLAAIDPREDVIEREGETPEAAASDESSSEAPVVTV